MRHELCTGHHKRKTEFEPGPDIRPKNTGEGCMACARPTACVVIINVNGVFAYPNQERKESHDPGGWLNDKEPEKA